MREWGDNEPLGWGFRIEATIVTSLVCIGLLSIPMAAISLLARFILRHF